MFHLGWIIENPRFLIVPIEIGQIRVCLGVLLVPCANKFRPRCVEV